MMKWIWFGGGFCVGLATLSLSIASVPKAGQVTDDTALYQNLSEIKVPKQGKVDFDNDLERLSAMEGRYQEKNLAPLGEHPRLKAPIRRVSQQKYRYSGKHSAPSRSKPLRKGARSSQHMSLHPTHSVAHAPIAPKVAAPSIGVPEEVSVPSAPVSGVGSRGVQERFEAHSR